jgi:hypothetical protein
VGKSDPLFFIGVSNSFENDKSNNNIISSKEDSIRYELSSEKLRSFIEKDNPTANKKISNEVCNI